MVSEGFLEPIPVDPSPPSGAGLEDFPQSGDIHPPHVTSPDCGFSVVLFPQYSQCPTRVAARPRNPPQLELVTPPGELDPKDELRSCQFCDKQLGSYRALSIHIGKVHKDKLAQKPKPKPKKKAKKAKKKAKKKVKA